MADFTYVRAHSLQEAVDLLAEPDLKSRILAGGTDLVNQFRSGDVTCDRVVDVAHVPERRAAPGQDLLVRATVCGDAAAVRLCVDYDSGTGDACHLEMQAREPHLYQATIPGAAITPGLRYRIGTLFTVHST